MLPALQKSSLSFSPDLDVRLFDRQSVSPEALLETKNHSNIRLKRCLNYFCPIRVNPPGILPPSVLMVSHNKRKHLPLSLKAVGKTSLLIEPQGKKSGRIFLSSPDGMMR